MDVRGPATARSNRVAAAAIASSSDSNEATGATGPKISSLRSFASGGTSLSTVGSKK